MKQYLALLFLFAPVISHAHTTGVKMESITQCASKLLSDSYRLEINLDVNKGQVKVDNFSMTDGSSQEVGEIPQHQLKEFTKCIAPLLSLSKKDITFEE
ncbi:hypothetical protein IHC87_05585 [Photobacterium damselae subsp. damselae]|uniref:hypothetical protein n=1 Tax=Photobacterium damselae TaxID=38293 RepID=UPI001F3B1471|nr:hypothetical protein [Photobacterium damselae]UJZ94841.1 hypothetical protein IHC87_05585 [Photobacterium damselae subsp. damselae]UJZ98825.1 hypothetical protein IHC88_05590 [Photobacterium damselae subsp. damselae]